MRTALAQVVLALTLALVSAALWMRGQVMFGLIFSGLLTLSLAWKRVRRSGANPPATTQVPAPVPTDVNWMDVLWRCTQCIERSKSLDDALLSVSGVLGSEVGAVGVRALRVEPKSAHSVNVRLIDSVFSEIEGYRPVACAVPLDRFPLGVAITRQEVVGDQNSGYAAPVSGSGEVVAVIEIPQITLHFMDQALRQFLQILVSQLNRRHAEEFSPDPLAHGHSEEVGLKTGVQSLEPSSALMEAVPEALFVFEANSLRLLDFNELALQRFARSRQVARGAALHEVFPTDFCAPLETAMRQAVHDFTSRRRERPQPFALHVPWPLSLGCTDGVGVVHVQLVVTPDKRGQSPWLWMMVRDVTAEQAVQSELSESKALLQHFADTVGECLFVTSPHRGGFHFLAGSLFEVWGVTRESLASDPSCILARVMEEDRPVFAQHMVADPKDQDFTFRIHHPTKGQRWLRARTRSLLLAGATRKACRAVRDITEDKKYEAELRLARDAAESAGMAKNRFMASMSHEIRTPMNGILGMTELLLGTPLQSNQRRFAQAVYRSGESLLGIINDILDFSNIESGRLDLAPTDFSLRSVVEETLELLAPTAHEKGLDIQFREEPGVPAGAHGDASRIRQVLTNLVTNAIKFTHEGEVLVELRRVPPDDGHWFWVEFRIRDTGIGIEPEKLPQLFGAFTQASSDLSRQYGGTGLGLTISKQLVEIMGGSLGVVSGSGQGSEFSFVLPLQPAQGTVRPIPNDDEMPALRVLVVDDHATNRAILKGMLGAWGMRVTVVESGQQALDTLSDSQLRQQPFDLALVDMHMPNMDGLALARAVDERGLRGAMHMVLLSSLSSPGDARLAASAGFQRFLTKPVRRAELRQTMASLWSWAQDEADGSSQRPLLDGSVLVVEDNPVNQEVIGQMLRGWGLRVQIASDAVHGLRSLCESHFDLVLMDIMMPGVDGIEAVRSFRRGQSEKLDFKTPITTPVIAVTANALEGDEERFLSLGFNDYLSKPFRQNQLFIMLTRYLRRQAMMTAPSGDHDKAGALPGRSDVAQPALKAGEQPAHWETVLDRAALERLGELDPNGQNKLMQRVVDAFETSVARLIPQIELASQTHDRDGMRHVAHTLKSSSASIGALRLSRMCAELEALIRLERSDDHVPHVDRICRETEVVLKALREVVAVASTFSAAAKGQSIGTST